MLEKLSSPFSHKSIPALYLSILRCWRYSAKSTPLLSIIIDSLCSFIPFIHSSSARLPLYDTNFKAILLNVSSIIHFFWAFLFPLLDPSHIPQLILYLMNTSQTINPTPALSSRTVPLPKPLQDTLFSSLVSLLSTLTTFLYLPHLSRLNAILEVLHTIKTLDTRRITLVSDSQSCLMALKSSPLISSISYLLLQIRSILLSLSSGVSLLTFYVFPVLLVF